MENGMKKIVNILLGAMIFIFVGCGTTGENPQGAVGNYQTFGSQSLSGVWNMYYDKAYNGDIDTNNVSAILEFDEYGSIYSLSSTTSVAKEKVATYDLISDQEIRLTGAIGTATVQYLQAHETDNSCFYVRTTYNNQAETELWCKRVISDDTVNNDQYGVIPPITQGTGDNVYITSYFFPYETLRDGYAYKDYLVTMMDASGYMTDQNTIVKHYLEGNKNGNGDSIISVFQDNSLIKKSIIEENYVSVNTYNLQGISTGTEQYAQYMRVNEDLLRNEMGACILKEKIDNLSLSEIIPAQADPYRSGSITHYTNVLLFYCGTSNGTKIDRYYADAYGEIVEIYHYNDGSIGYSVFDKQTDQNP